TERVAVGPHVHEPEEARACLRDLLVALRREQDEAGAGPHDREVLPPRTLDEEIVEVEGAQELRDRRALAAGHDEAIERRELLPAPDRADLALEAQLRV